MTKTLLLYVKKLSDFPGGPVVKTSLVQGVWVWSLVRDPTSLLAKKSKTNRSNIVTNSMRHNNCNTLKTCLRHEEGEKRGSGHILSYFISPGCRAESLATGAPLSPCPCCWDHSPLNNFPAGSGVMWHCYFFFLTSYVILSEKYKVNILFNKSLIIDFFPWIPLLDTKSPKRES